MRRRLALATLLTGLILATALPPASVEGKRKPRRVPCPGGTFLVIGDSLIPGGAPPFEDRLQLGGGRLAFSSGCPATAMKARATRRGTRVRARWSGCPGLAGHVRLKGVIDPLTCSVMVGKLRAKKMNRTFQAVLEQG